MLPLADLSLTDALEVIVSREEHAAAGIAAGTTCAAAAALVELTAQLAADRVAREGKGKARTSARLRALGTRSAQIRGRVLTALEEDRRAVARISAARSDPAGSRAVAEASEPPLTIAETAAEVAEAAAETVRAGSWSFTADAVAAGELAAGAARASAGLATANLASSPSDRRIPRARAAVKRAESARRAAASSADAD